MKRKTTYDIILFTVLMVLLFLPLLQSHVLHIPLKSLNGVTVETEKPDFDLESYRSGDYAKQKEAYVGEHFGFREPVIRLYNQYLWSCYKKTYAHDVMAGKRGWLYTPESVSDYYGTELLNWQPSLEVARNKFEREVKYLCHARDILKENDVELLAFIAPEKSFVYPEYLPDGEHDTTTFNACATFLHMFEENSFPCIDMTNWFEQMKDTVNYPVIPQTGAHWVFPAVYAADSLFRFMGDLKGIELPKLKIGELHESDNHGADNDLERLLNLLLPIRKRQGYSPTAAVTVESGPNSVKPKVLFVGNSFMWGITNQVPMREVFDDVEFWYYFSTAYSGDDLAETTPVVDLNMLEKLLDFDYIVWFTTGNQLNKGTSGFAQSVILTLGVDDNIRQEYIDRIADTLTFDSFCTDTSHVSANGRTRHVPTTTDSIRRKEAIAILHNHPEIIPELNADTLTSQNRNIPYAKYTKDIRKDSTWMAALEAQAFLRTATMDLMLRAEVDRIKAGKPLFRDQAEEIRFSLLCQEEVQQRIKRIPSNAELLEHIRKDAEKHNKPLDQAIEDAAIWITKEKYDLYHYQLINDPDAVIHIPPDFQLK